MKLQKTNKSIKKGGFPYSSKSIYRIHSMVKLKDPPKYPVETIRIHAKNVSPKKVYSDIDPYNPPYNIKYSMLEKIYSSDILNIEIEKLTDNAEEIAMEIANNSNTENIEEKFHKTIKNKYKECKTIARQRLWTFFYTTMIGTVYNTKEPITIAQAIKEADTIEDDMRKQINKRINNTRIDESDDSSNAKKMHGANGSKEVNTDVIARYLSLNIYSLAWRVWTALWNNPNTPVIKPRYITQDYNDRMRSIKDDIIVGLQNKGIDDKKIKVIRSELMSALTLTQDKVIESLKMRDTIEAYKYNLLKLHERYPPRKDNYGRENIIYTPFHSVKLYGMALPYQFDRLELFRNIAYFVEVLGINSYVDLHDCEGWTNFNGCNPYDTSIEREMVNLVIKVRNMKEFLHISRKYINIRGYVDMTPGSYLAWYKISKIPDITKHKTLVHCYAGLGRTGSVLLFLLLRDINESTVVDLQQPHFNKGDILSLINYLSNLFESDLENKKVVNELFNTETFLRIYLLQRRLNRIFFFLAKIKKLPTFYLYRDKLSNMVWDSAKAYFDYCAHKASNTDVVNHFSEYVLYSIDWDKHDSSYISNIEQVLNGHHI